MRPKQRYCFFYFFIPHILEKWIFNLFIHSWGVKGWVYCSTLFLYFVNNIFEKDGIYMWYIWWFKTANSFRHHPDEGKIAETVSSNQKNPVQTAQLKNIFHLFPKLQLYFLIWNPNCGKNTYSCLHPNWTSLSSDQHIPTDQTEAINIPPRRWTPTR